MQYIYYFPYLNIRECEKIEFFGLSLITKENMENRIDINPQDKNIFKKLLSVYQIKKNDCLNGTLICDSENVIFKNEEKKN